MQRSAFRLFLACLLLCVAVIARAETPSSAPLFNTALSDLDDKPVTLERYKGKALIINFWARWCGPCRQEIPDLIKLRASYKSKGLEVIGIGIEDKTEAVRDFIKAYEMDYPVVIAKDKGIPLMQALGNSKGGLPFTVVVDSHGQIVQSRLGAMKKADLEAAAEMALKSK